MKCALCGSDDNLGRCADCGAVYCRKCQLNFKRDYKILYYHVYCPRCKGRVTGND